MTEGRKGNGSAAKPQGLRYLVVTADDFGLSVEVNAAVEDGYRAGILSAASLMVNGPAAADAVRRARAMPGLRIGLHLVLVDGKPVLPPARIPHLVDDSGALRCDLFRLATEIALNGTIRRELRAELTAQFFAFERAGFALDHVDVHKHFHLHPVVAREILSVGARFGMRSLRVPREPRAVLRAAGGDRASFEAMLRPWVNLLAARAHRANLVVADAVFGLAWTGKVTPERIAALIDHLPDGFVEIYLHPAVTNDFPGHAKGYCYTDELAALTATESADALRRSGFLLAGYGDMLALRLQSACAPA